MDTESKAQNSELPGEQILEKCAFAYLAISEFEGSCVVNRQTTTSLDGASPVTNSSTAQAYFDFKRGNHFNIKGHQADGNPFSVESDATQTTLTDQYREQVRVRKYPELINAVGTITGTAMGAATTITALLTRAAWGFPFMFMMRATFIRHELLEKHSCFVVVQNSGTAGETSTFWIDSESFLLRQMRDDQGERSEEDIKEWKELLASRGRPYEPDYKILGTSTVHVFSTENVVFNAE